MRHIMKFDKIPDNSIISNGFGKTDYCDSYKVYSQTSDNIDKITSNIFKTPKWIDFLMSIRNSTVKFFGLKIGDKEDLHFADHYPIGSKAVYFTVIARNDNEIVMAENDKHLNFRTSVLISKQEANSIIYLTMIVKFNNIWGRIYFLPVKPFHRIIINSLLKRAIL